MTMAARPGPAHLVLAAHALHVDVQVQLAHAADDGLPGVGVGGHSERGVLALEALQRLAERAARVARAGITARLITGSGTFMLVIVYLRVQCYFRRRLSARHAGQCLTCAPEPQPHSLNTSLVHRMNTEDGRCHTPMHFSAV